MADRDYLYKGARYDASESRNYDSANLEVAWQLCPSGPDYEEGWESWQYVGSRFWPSEGVAVHDFRHRCYHGERLVIHVMDSEAGLHIIR